MSNVYSGTRSIIQIMPASGSAVYSNSGAVSTQALLMWALCTNDGAANQVVGIVSMSSGLGWDYADNDTNFVSYGSADTLPNTINLIQNTVPFGP